MSNPHDLAAEAWEQFLRTAVSDGAQPHEVFAWAYMAGWAHGKWPAVRDIVPPPDVTGRAATCGCPSFDGVIRHQRATCDDPDMARLDWYADQPR